MDTVLRRFVLTGILVNVRMIDNDAIHEQTGTSFAGLI